MTEQSGRPAAMYAPARERRWEAVPAVMQHDIRLASTQTVAILVGGLVLALLLGGIVSAALIVSHTVVPGSLSFVRLMRLNSELGIPATMSALGLGCCAALLAVLTVVHRALGRRFVLHWLLLTLIFAFMAVDEGASIHETFNAPVGRLGFRGYLQYGWVVVAMPVVVFVGIGYIRFLLHLPRQYGLGMAVAGALFVGGALGVEMINAKVRETNAFDSLPYNVLVVIEEGLEMAGTGLLFVVLWSLLAHLPWRLRGRVTERGAMSGGS